MIMAVLFLPVLFFFHREKFFPTISFRESFRAAKNFGRKIKNPLGCEWVGIFSLLL
jgi:hypothetical protein